MKSDLTKEGPEVMITSGSHKNLAHYNNLICLCLPDRREGTNERKIKETNVDELSTKKNVKKEGSSNTNK